jgi:putative alpha-1,2-mannosidase
VNLNGKPYEKCFLMYDDIAKGGELELIMESIPNKEWGLKN